ncbi:ATP-binding protein [Devosia sp. J2-20]|uniref:ATP-binding protein n=1 Tax=Devosia sp. J2-20 TaxID=3026161 RepID=UPI002499CE55|nr:ATP-binding protein [Devosia sp. J2-20]WDQ99671.1 ATP-binding protein [Devosia sp. J2-20]
MAKHSELWLLPIFGPSGATKSKTIKIVLDEILAKRADRTMVPVRYLKVDGATKTTRQLQVRLLETLSSAEAAELAKGRYYSEPKANARLRDLARKDRTTLIVLDEAHAMLKETTIDRMAAGLKSLLNHGVFSIVLIGTDELRPLFRHSELRSRTEMPLDFSSPGRPTMASCVNLFQFAEKFCAALYDEGVIDSPFRPTSTISHCAVLYDITGGVLGQIIRHFRRALQYAFAQNLRTLDWTSIQFAYSSWATLDGVSSHQDPFIEGPKASTVTVVRKISDEMKSHASR